MAHSPHQDILEIAQDASVLRFAPQAGGRLLSWIIDGEEVIHWPEYADWSQPARIRGGNPLLFPFLGRHRVDGKIGLWRDAQGTVRELPMHGFARDLPFEAHADVHGAGLRMTLTDSDATRARLSVRLPLRSGVPACRRHTLDVELTTANTGDDARCPTTPAITSTSRCPTRSAARPCWNCRAPSGAISRPTARSAPAEPGEPRYTLDEARILDRFHCLDGAPDQPVRLVAPGLNRAITIDLQRPGSVPWYAVTTWTEAAESDFYCVEPWLGLPDAIHNGLGLRWLEPGQTETAALRITVGALR